jgi:hypothetical protein
MAEAMGHALQEPSASYLRATGPAVIYKIAIIFKSTGYACLTRYILLFFSYSLFSTPLFHPSVCRPRALTNYVEIEVD